MFERTGRKLTLAERIQAKLRGPEEGRIYNPLGALKEGGLRVGDSVRLDTLDLAGKDFVLLAIHEGTIFTDGRSLKLVDYDLEHDPADGGDKIQRRLRVFRKPAPSGEAPFEMALLWLDDS